MNNGFVFILSPYNIRKVIPINEEKFLIESKDRDYELKYCDINSIFVFNSSKEYLSKIFISEVTENLKNQGKEIYIIESNSIFRKFLNSPYKPKVSVLKRQEKVFQKKDNLEKILFEVYKKKCYVQANVEDLLEKSLDPVLSYGLNKSALKDAPSYYKSRYSYWVSDAISYYEKEVNKRKSREEKLKYLIELNKEKDFQNRYFQDRVKDSLKKIDYKYSGGIEKFFFQFYTFATTVYRQIVEFYLKRGGYDIDKGFYTNEFGALAKDLSIIYYPYIAKFIVLILVQGFLNKNDLDYKGQGISLKKSAWIIFWRLFSEQIIHSKNQWLLKAPFYFFNDILSKKF